MLFYMTFYMIDDVWHKFIQVISDNADFFNVWLNKWDLCKFLRATKDIIKEGW